MSTHAARIDHSDRRRRVAELLADGEEHTTLEIIARAQVCAVNSIVDELRGNGRVIECTRRGNVWYYREVL